MGLERTTFWLQTTGVANPTALLRPQGPFFMQETQFDEPMLFAWWWRTCGFRVKPRTESHWSFTGGGCSSGCRGCQSVHGRADVDGGVMPLDASPTYATGHRVAGGSEEEGCDLCEDDDADIFDFSALQAGLTDCLSRSALRELVTNCGPEVQCAYACRTVGV